MLRRRGYALTRARLAAVCLGGPLPESEVRWAVGADPDLQMAEGLVVERVASCAAATIRERADGHAAASPAYLEMAVEFVRKLVAVAPFITSVSIAGSLASGGFRESDDVDLNLVVEDGYRHLAYVALNVLGLLHALRHRGKPVDAHTARPLAPRLMTANLVLERSACFPLLRQDEDMAYELFSSRPVVGGAFLATLIEANPRLAGHFPQLARRPAFEAPDARSRVPGWLYPRSLDRPARAL